MVTFRFTPNDFFENEVLTKKYVVESLAAQEMELETMEGYGAPRAVARARMHYWRH